MRTSYREPRPIPFRFFEDPEMRAHLRNQDIAGVFRLLQRCGVSQRRIAAMTGQSQSEICEILAGRQVYAHHVLVRICDGFGLPHGWMGLAYDDTPPTTIYRPTADVEQAVADALLAIDRIALRLRIDVGSLRGQPQAAQPVEGQCNAVK